MASELDNIAIKLHATTDGAVWAAEFSRIAKELGYSDMDEGWLIGWFANAIECGRNAGLRFYEQTRAPVAEDGLAGHQITMGDGLVDVGPITWQGKRGILFRPRKTLIPVGDPGELQNTEYWPTADDVVIWMSESSPKIITEIMADVFHRPTVAGNDLVDELEARAVSYDQSGPSAQHTAVLLRRAAHALRASAGTRDGWKLVPEEPTEAMMKAAGDAFLDATVAHVPGDLDNVNTPLRRLYRAAVTASPSPDGADR